MTLTETLIPHKHRYFANGKHEFGMPVFACECGETVMVCLSPIVTKPVETLPPFDQSKSDIKAMKIGCPTCVAQAGEICVIANSPGESFMNQADKSGHVIPIHQARSRKAFQDRK